MEMIVGVVIFVAGFFLGAVIMHLGQQSENKR